MRKIISGKSYDTETAKELCREDHHYPSDFSYWEETLYLKRTGEYFIYGYGGPMTRWAESYSSGTSSYGSGIMPLTDNEARTWVERNANDEYESIFGMVEE